MNIFSIIISGLALFLGVLAWCAWMEIEQWMWERRVLRLRQDFLLARFRKSA